MKAKILIALAALLMLGSVSLNAQEVGNSSNSESTTQLEGDLNHDNKVDVADVTYLVNLIMKNQSEAKDGMYYWYIGVDNPTTISNIQTENTKAGWHEIGTSLDGFVLDATNTDNQVILNTENVKYYYYVVIPNNLHIYDSSNTNNVEELYFESATCNIAGYKVLHYKIEPGTRVVKGIIIKENIPVSGAMGSGTFAPLCKLELLTNKQNEYEDKVFLFSGNAAWAQWGQAPLRPFRAY